MDGLPLENCSKSVKIDGRRVSYSAADFEGTDRGQQNEAAQAAATRPRRETTPKVEIEINAEENGNGFLEPF